MVELSRPYVIVDDLKRDKPMAYMPLSKLFTVPQYDLIIVINMILIIRRGKYFSMYVPEETQNIMNFTDNCKSIR